MTKPVDFPSPDETTTLVRGSTVLLADTYGEAQPTALLGLFCRDERLLSKLSVLVDGIRPPLLSHGRNGASSVRIASLASLDEYRNGQALLVRRGTVREGGYDETLELRSFSQGRTVALEIVLESDGSSVLKLRTGKPALDALIWSLDDDGSALALRDGVPFVRVSFAPSAPASDSGGPQLRFASRPTSGAEPDRQAGSDAPAPASDSAGPNPSQSPSPEQKVLSSNQQAGFGATASASLSVEGGGTRVALRWEAEVSSDQPWTTSWSVERLSVLSGNLDSDGNADLGSGAMGGAVGVEPEVLPGGVAERDARRRRERTYPALGRLSVSADDYRWSKALSSATDDLEALIIELPEEGHRFIAAGAPWFLALFGRDSLIAAWQSLPLGTDLPLDVLETLSAHQGVVVNERTQEAPGKILHERRIGRPQVFGMTEGATYYGSVDSSALFVMLLAETYRWGGSVSRIRALLPAARAAIAWCLGAGRDAGPFAGSPFLWYRSDAKGLGNQGWKDSGDCMVHADGLLALGPYAVAEAQGYLYEALRGMARLERDLGDPLAADSFDAGAGLLAAAFHSEFVLADGLVAMALVGDGVPLQVASSNMGQVLWSGILSSSAAVATGERTMRADLLSHWGIRTLGSSTRAYNPMGYHLGTVWAHDSAIIAAGMARHGQGASTRLLVDSLLAACEAFQWRLPELFAGIDTPGDTQPLPYPAACSPQAWSAGAPLLLLRSILGFTPDVPAGFVAVSPMLAEGSNLSVAGIRLGDGTISISACGSAVVSSAGVDGLEVRH
jgi:glycogen debranching enzyme